MFQWPEGEWSISPIIDDEEDIIRRPRANEEDL
jgi:hypothetical protein